MTVAVQSYIQQPASERIPTATGSATSWRPCEARSTPERTYVISGHYDSRVTDVMDRTSDAPEPTTTPPGSRWRWSWRG